MSYLSPYWVELVDDEVTSARKKFPHNKHLAMALAEESGEAIKAIAEYREGKGSLKAVKKELIQTIAMCVRLLHEGDSVEGLKQSIYE